MTAPSRLFPRQSVPSLEVLTLDGGQWRLSERQPQNFTLIVVYRGLHCPICKGYLRDLERRLPEFGRRGVEAIAISSDEEVRARQAKADWGLSQLTIGYGLGLDDAREWGLYISAGIGRTSGGADEPSRFVEPGLFLVRPNRTLYFASVQTMPFARPSVEDVLKAIVYILDKNYPARGEILDLAEAAA